MRYHPLQSLAPAGARRGRGPAEHAAGGRPDRGGGNEKGPKSLGPDDVAGPAASAGVTTTLLNNKFDVYCPFAIGHVIEPCSIVQVLISSDIPSAQGLVKGARVFPQACDALVLLNPCVDVGICMASPNITQPRALQRNLYQCVRLANNEHQLVADIRNQTLFRRVVALLRITSARSFHVLWFMLSCICANPCCINVVYVCIRSPNLR